MSRVAHMFNFTIYNGLKSLDIKLAWLEEEFADEILNGSKYLSTSSFIMTLGKLLICLHRLITAIKMSLQKIRWYQNMCEDYFMLNNNRLKVDYPTR